MTLWQTPERSQKLNLELYPLRVSYLAHDSIAFPSGKAGNVFRGAFGLASRKIACIPECPRLRGGSRSECGIAPPCAYARLFAPVQKMEGPSGLADSPRPYVFRCAHLDGRIVNPGEPFYCDVHLFDTGSGAEKSFEFFMRTFAQIAQDGLGARRGKVDLLSVMRIDAPGVPLGGAPLRLDLSPDQEAVEMVTVLFETPTELKAEGKIVRRPEFGVLLGRIRDRIAMLRALYGAGPLDIDFGGMTERANRVRLQDCDLQQMRVERRSSRTGQTHSIGGFTGRATYAGDVAEFLPWLRAAAWTGVGRQTAWGKGQIGVETLKNS